MEKFKDIEQVNDDIINHKKREILNSLDKDIIIEYILNGNLEEYLNSQVGINNYNQINVDIDKEFVLKDYSSAIDALEFDVDLISGKVVLDDDNYENLFDVVESEELRQSLMSFYNNNKNIIYKVLNKRDCKLSDDKIMEIVSCLKDCYIIIHSKEENKFLNQEVKEEVDTDKEVEEYIKAIDENVENSIKNLPSLFRKYKINNLVEKDNGLSLGQKVVIPSDVDILSRNIVFDNDDNFNMINSNSSNEKGGIKK